MKNYRKIEIIGFEESSEPEIRIYKDGHIKLIFSYMPPLNSEIGVDNFEYWESFENVLSEHLDVLITRDDDEIFIIKYPEEDTVEKLKIFLENYWIEIH
jgi:hypothetical protein